MRGPQFPQIPLASTARRRARVIVVGGGLAGLSAAVSCVDAGLTVSLFEGRPRLGGATWSFERRGLMFDNGQHVHLRCCAAYRSWLDRLGTAELAPLNGRLAIPVLATDSTGHTDVAWIRRNFMPAPLHLGAALLSYRHLELADRLRLLPAALGLRMARLDDPRLDDETFAAWLRRHGQSDAAIGRLWDLISLPTTNLRAEDVSLALAAKVFQTGLLTDKSAADIGWSTVPLADLHVEPARRLLETAGADVRVGSRVDELVLSGPSRGSTRTVRGVAIDGEVIESEAVILAVPHDAAARLVPPEAMAPPPAPDHIDNNSVHGHGHGHGHGNATHTDTDSFLIAGGPEQLTQLGTSPIVNVHLVFDRKVMPYRVAAAVGSPVQFVFDRTEASGLSRAPDGARGGQVLAISLSGADAEIGVRPEVLIERQLAAVRELFPAARQAMVRDAVVTREHDATFRGVPGTRRLRLGTATRVANLALAGAWTDTGWPATMEGAVLSGRAAAAQVASLLGAPLPLGVSATRKEVVA